MSDGAPKSAFELAMEKLKRQDDASGAEAVALSNDQVAAIAEARSAYAAQVAECEILLDSALAATFDPSARDELQANHRRDLARITADRDRKIARVRGSESRVRG